MMPLQVLLILVGSMALSAYADDRIQLLSERSPEAGPQLLVLGTAHFSNPGQNVVNFEVEDVMSSRRQEEMKALNSRLATFRPTHIAVEWPATGQNRLDARYNDYLEGQYDLGRGEEDQIGLQLAANLGHERVFAIDWNDYPPGELDQYNWLNWGEKNGYADWISAMRDPTRSRGQIELGDQSIANWLRKINQPENLATSHRMYFNYAMIGDEDHQPGANWLGHWYARNMRIFANLVRLTDDTEARILVVYGSGHAHLLLQFARESGAFRLVEVNDVLSVDP